MIISVRKYRWQCIECKCCSICGTSDNDVRFSRSKVLQTWEKRRVLAFSSQFFVDFRINYYFATIATEVITCIACRHLCQLRQKARGAAHCASKSSIRNNWRIPFFSCLILLSEQCTTSYLNSKFSSPHFAYSRRSRFLFGTFLFHSSRTFAIRFGKKYYPM